MIHGSCFKLADDFLEKGVGILGHAVRFAVFAFMPQNPAVNIAVQVLHGICYAFFFATLPIFIDATFPKDVRSSGQSLFNLLVLGAGDFAGLGSSRTRRFPWSTPFRNPHIPWYRKSNPVNRLLPITLGARTG